MKKRLKEKAGWDWDGKKKEYENGKKSILGEKKRIYIPSINPPTGDHSIISDILVWLGIYEG